MPWNEKSKKGEKKTLFLRKIRELSNLPSASYHLLFGYRVFEESSFCSRQRGRPFHTFPVGQDHLASNLRDMSIVYLEITNPCSSLIPGPKGPGNVVLHVFIDGVVLRQGARCLWWAKAVSPSACLCNGAGEEGKIGQAGDWLLMIEVYACTVNMPVPCVCMHLCAFVCVWIWKGTCIEYLWLCRRWEILGLQKDVCVCVHVLWFCVCLLLCRMQVV